MYSETPICRHPSQQDTPLVRTVESVTKALISVKMNPSNKDTPLLRTEFSSPISVLIRGVSL